MKKVHSKLNRQIAIAAIPENPVRQCNVYAKSKKEGDCI